MTKVYLLLVVALLGTGSLQAQVSFGTKIGQTYYDQQSHASGGSRLVRHWSGSISATWAESCVSDPVACPNCPYPTLGAGYNSFNGTSWVHGPDGTCDEPGSDFGVFSARAESPEIIVFPSGKEMVIGHDASGFVSASRVTGGAGPSPWSGNQPVGPSGTIANINAKVAITGASVHMIASCQSCTTAQGVSSPVHYFRSPDEGSSWDIADQPLPGLDSFTFSHIEAGNYAIHANGNTVAIVAGSARPGNQLAMWKSNNNGINWSKTVIRSFALSDTVTTLSNPNAQYIVNTLLLNHALYETNDNSLAVLVDNNGYVHVWSGLLLLGIERANPQNSVSFPLHSEGIWYWREIQPTLQLIVNERENIHPVGDPMDFVGDGTYTNPPTDRPYGNIGLLSMPQATLAIDNSIYLVYSGIVEGTYDSLSYSAQSYRDLYMMKGSVASPFWSQPVNIAFALTGQRASTTEEVFPSVVRHVLNDNIVHLTFQRDNLPGLHTAHDFDPESLNYIMYVGISVANWPNITPSLPQVSAAQPFIEAIPNPTSGLSTLRVRIDGNAGVSVRVTNLLGQEVFSLPERELSGDEEHQLSLDLSAFPGGVYLYSVSINGQVRTQRLVKE